MGTEATVKRKRRYRGERDVLCVRVCVRERERERERVKERWIPIQNYVTVYIRRSMYISL